MIDPWDLVLTLFQGYETLVNHIKEAEDSGFSEGWIDLTEHEEILQSVAQCLPTQSEWADIPV